MNKLKRLEQTGLRPEQLKHMFRKATGKELKVVMLNEVNESDTVDTLFSNGCFVLYLPVLSEYNGHFVSLMKKNNAIYFLDSYGNTPAKLLEIINSKGTVDDKDTLFRIIKSSGLDAYYSTMDYQSHDPTISDCGRYSVLNCIWYENSEQSSVEYDLKVYYDILSNFMKENNTNSFDDAVTIMTAKLD